MSEAVGTTIDLTSLEEEKEHFQSERARVEIPSVTTLQDVQERSKSKVQILKTKLPKFPNAACTIEEVLSAESREDLQSKRTRVEIPPLPSVPTLQDCQERLMRKVQILKTELPKAESAFCTMEEVLSAKAKGFRYTDFRRATELAVLVSRMKVLSGSLRSMIFTTSKNPTNKKAWITVAMAVMGSGAIREFIMTLMTDLGDREDTREIDTSVVVDVCTSIHEITKDIADSFQV